MSHFKKKLTLGLVALACLASPASASVSYGTGHPVAHAASSADSYGTGHPVAHAASSADSYGTG